MAATPASSSRTHCHPKHTLALDACSAVSKLALEQEAQRELPLAAEVLRTRRNSPWSKPPTQGFVQLGLDKFRAVLSELLVGPFDVSALQADVDRWAAQIDESVKTDPAGSGYEDWRGNVGYLKEMIAKRYEESAAIRDKV
jgi:hypothetical protein